MIKDAIGSARRRKEREVQRTFQKTYGKWLREFKHEAVLKTKLRAPRKKSVMKDLVPIIERINLIGFEWGAIQSLKALGFNAKLRVMTKAPLDFMLTNEEVLDAIASHASDAAGYILENSVVESSRLMVETLEGGGTLNQARQKVAAYLQDDGWRSYLISNTEFGYGLGTARHNVYDRSGVEEHRWITVGDDRVRSLHLTNEGDGWIPISQEFSSGALHPGDGPSPYNCRCAEEANLSDPNLILDPWQGD